jgi:cyclopropane fatty-acyl-phospholipid synthase-like methyltransferase
MLLLLLSVLLDVGSGAGSLLSIVAGPDSAG